MKNKIVFVITLFICISLFANLMGTVKAAYEDTAQKYAPILDFEKDEITGGITENSLKCISPTLQIELANAITEQRTLTQDELQGLE